MANFRTRRQVTTRKPVVQVDPGLPAGEYRFQLVMVGINNKRSKPHFITVKISQRIGRGTPGIGHAGAEVARSKDAIDERISVTTGQKSKVTKGTRKKQSSKKSTKKIAKKKVTNKKTPKKKKTKKNDEKKKIAKKKVSKKKVSKKKISKNKVVRKGRKDTK